MCIVELASKIPDVVWSGLIASTLTLSGVLLSNWSNTNRLKLQLKHDSEEKTKQRKADMRQEVYLLAAEELVKANGYLAALPQLDLSKSNAADGMQGFFAAAAKLQMIAETKTTLLVAELVGTYGVLLLKSLEKVRPIHDLQTKARIASEHYDRTQSEISRILSAMTQLNESANSDPQLFDALSKSFEFQRDQADKYSEDRNQSYGSKNSLHIAFAKEFITEIKIAQERTMALMVEIRRELDVDSDIQAFTEQLERQRTRMTTQLDALLNSLQQAT